MNKKLMITMLVVFVAATALLGCRKKQHDTGVAAPVSEATPPASSTDFQQQQPMSGETAPKPGVGEEELNLVQSQLGDVYYDFDKYNLKPEARETLARNAEVLKQHPAVNVFVEGHCDERGTNEYNLALGERRATASKNYLVQSGVAPERLYVISYGEERPQCFEHGESCWWKNRRAHFAVRR